VLVEKGGPELNGFADLDPRPTFQALRQGASGFGQGSRGGYQLGAAEAGEPQTSE
jgi:hypothetical protein